MSIADFSAPQHGAQMSSDPANRPTAFTEAARLFEAGKLTLPVASTFALQQADEAHAASEHGHVAGRRIIVVD